MTPVLFCERRRNARAAAAGRRQVNLLATRKREHSRKPGELYLPVEACSPGPRLEVFARGTRPGWTTWGDEAERYAIGWETYGYNSGGAAWAEAAEKGSSRWALS